jgi:dienelactone hydrolase
MYRVLMCAAAGALFIASQAVAQEKVLFPSTDGDLKGGTPTTITGYLYKPTGSGPFAAVVGMHGCGGLWNEKEGEISSLYAQWGEILSRAGYIFLLIDSFKPRGYGDICANPVGGFPVLPDKEMPRDAFGALNYLRSRPDVRPDSIAIFGQFYGGIAVIFTINDGTLPKDQKDFRAAIMFYPACGPYVVSHTNGRWRPRQRTLLLMGDADNWTPAAPCKEFIARAEGGPSIDAHFYPDTYHAFDWPNLPITVRTDVKLAPDGHSPTMGENPEARADAITRVTQFLTKQLR